MKEHQDILPIGTLDFDFADLSRVVDKVNELAEAVTRLNQDMMERRDGSQLAGKITLASLDDNMRSPTWEALLVLIQDASEISASINTAVARALKTAV